MIPADFSSTASRLCAECGMCCNGVLFHSVRLQPSDSPKALVGLGLKLKRKRGETLILQPCPAHKASCCTIYASRPERCQKFECRQLKRVATGESTEAQAMENIHDARRRVAGVNDLLQRASVTNVRRPLSKRVEKVLNESAMPDSEELRTALVQQMQALEALLDREFRPPPLPTPPTAPALLPRM